MHVNAATWAAVWISAGTALASVAGLVFRGGRRDGRVDAVLEQLARITGDHERRIRAVELEVGRHRRR